MSQQVKKYVQTCVPCQHRDPTRPEEELHPIWTSELFARVAVDVVYMPSDAGYSHLVVGRCDLSGWVEARPLTGATSEHVNYFSKNLLPGNIFQSTTKTSCCFVCHDDIFADNTLIAPWIYRSTSFIRPWLPSPTGCYVSGFETHEHTSHQ